MAWCIAKYPFSNRCTRERTISRGTRCRGIGVCSTALKSWPAASRRRVLHLITTFGVSSGAAENTRLTVNLLPRDRFEVFLGTRAGQGMEAQLADDVTRLAVPHLGRPVRPWSDAAAFTEIYRLCR